MSWLLEAVDLWLKIVVGAMTVGVAMLVIIVLVAWGLMLFGLVKIEQETTTHDNNHHSKKGPSRKTRDPSKPN